jgi:hypothetical protein
MLNLVLLQCSSNGVLLLQIREMISYRFFVNFRNATGFRPFKMATDAGDTGICKAKLLLCLGRNPQGELT